MLKLGYFRHAFPPFPTCLCSANDFSRVETRAEGKGSENGIACGPAVPAHGGGGWGGKQRDKGKMVTVRNVRLPHIPGLEALETLKIT